MKAITCPQCGALISKISSGDKFVFCDYCEAKILVGEDAKKTEPPELTPYQQYLKKRSENELKYNAMNPPVYSPGENEPGFGKVLVIFFGAMAALIFFLASGRSCLERPFEPTRKTVSATPAALPASTPYPLFSNEVEPHINYSVDVRWNGSNDMEHYEMPSIATESLPTLDEKELKKTVFAKRSVQVRITIDENGEVTEAKAISGHPILKEAAENAARKTLFSNRRKPTSRVLTYIFRLTSE